MCLKAYASDPARFERFSRKHVQVTVVQVPDATPEDDIYIERIEERDFPIEWVAPEEEEEEVEEKEDASSGSEAPPPAPRVFAHRVPETPPRDPNALPRPVPGKQCIQCNKRAAQRHALICDTCHRMCSVCRDQPCLGRYAKCYDCLFLNSENVPICPLCKLPAHYARTITATGVKACTACYRREERSRKAAKKGARKEAEEEEEEEMNE